MTPIIGIIKIKRFLKIFLSLAKLLVLLKKLNTVLESKVMITV